jgi:lipid-binding SYLF domain-containing protein
MKHLFFKTIFFIPVCLFLCVAVTAQNNKEKGEITRANETKDYFISEDSEIEGFFTKSYGYVVFPSIGKGGVGVGGAHGNGILFKGGAPQGKTSMTQATIGLQLGGQSFMEVIFFQDQRAYDNFVEGKTKLGAQASGVVLKQGAGATAAYNDGVAVFTAIKGGLMAEASVGGQKFKYKDWDN